MILTAVQYLEIREKLEFCERQIARFEKGPDPSDPDKQDNPQIVTALLSSYRAMARLYRKMIDQHVAETPTEDLA